MFKLHRWAGRQHTGGLIWPPLPNPMVFPLLPACLCFLFMHKPSNDVVGIHKAGLSSQGACPGDHDIPDSQRAVLGIMTYPPNVPNPLGWFSSSGSWHKIMKKQRRRECNGDFRKMSCCDNFISQAAGDSLESSGICHFQLSLCTWSSELSQSHSDTESPGWKD